MGVNTAAEHCVFLAGVRDTDAVIYVSHREFEELIEVDAGGVCEAQERVAGEAR